MFNRYHRATLMFLGVLLLGMTASTANADTIYVCWDGSGDYLTIQEGIDAASDGDEVVVCDGTYTGDGNRDLNFGGKPITVRSANGPAKCVIDCQGSEEESHRGFVFRSNEGPGAVVAGFTITNGYSAFGGAILCDEYCNPTIANCVITDNVDDYWGGGGVCCLLSSPTIIGCTIACNHGYEGGGIHCNASSATIRDCTITANTAMRGGGIFNYCGGNPAIANCVVWNNGPNDVSDWYADAVVSYSDIGGG